LAGCSVEREWHARYFRLMLFRERLDTHGGVVVSVN
jgi:hypothetical protein